jgi:hypothetical protein
MTTTQHTPGPWTQGDDNPLNIYGRYSNVAKVDGTHATGARTEEEALANARLIASAPELLAALQYAEAVLANLRDVQRWDHPSNIDPYGPNHIDEAVDAIDSIRDAIAAATQEVQS